MSHFDFRGGRQLGVAQVDGLDYVAGELGECLRLRIGSLVTIGRSLLKVGGYGAAVVGALTFGSVNIATPLRASARATS